MIRRFYILPLNPGVGDDKVREMVQVLNAADQFIPGLLDSSAGVDFDSSTVVWENSFINEEVYAGTYMIHPYHIGAIDNYVMGDSPECITHDIYTTRYELPGAIPKTPSGIRRVVLIKLAEGADTAALEALADRPAGMATSVLCPDNVGWVSAKGRKWSHIWEQGFADEAAWRAYLQTRDGVGGSSLEGLKRLGVDLDALQIFTYPFALNPVQAPAEMPTDSFPIHYTIIARTAPEDTAAYVGLVERYDAYVETNGGALVHRQRSVADGYPEAEVQSTWRFASLTAYHQARFKTATDPDWNHYVREAAPLVKGGTRRFYRAG